MYNFEVADFHSYFVTGSGVLVHNANENGCGRSNSGNDRRISNINRQESPIRSKFKNVKGHKGRKTSGEGKNRRYYEWDHTHNDIEVYDRNGKHLGSLDPRTGELYKGKVKGRKMGK